MFIVAVAVDVGVGMGGVPARLSKQEDADADAAHYGQDGGRSWSWDGRTGRTKLGPTEGGTDCLIAFVGLVTGRLNK